MNKCSIFGRRIYFWQDAIMTLNKFKMIDVPTLHSKCSDEQGNKSYYPKGE